MGDVTTAPASLYMVNESNKRRQWQDAASHLALVKVVDDLLVQLVLQLDLRRGLVAVPLGQVGGARLVRPLRREGGSGREG